MNSRMCFSLKRELGMQLNLAHVISSVECMALPMPLVDGVIDSVISDPEGANDFLETREKKHDSSGGVSSIFSDFVNSGGDRKFGRGGLVRGPDFSCLEGIIPESRKIVITPDVTYEGRRRNKPKIIFSEYLAKRPELSMQMQDRLRNFRLVRNFCKMLVDFREWQAGALREAYGRLGAVQREFIETLESSKLHVYLQEHLARDMKLHVSTIWRLLQGKFVRISSLDNGEQVYPAVRLLPCADKIRRYHVVPKINNILRKEFDLGRAYSDEEITDMMGRQIARRTLTKYRGKIPAKRKRQFAYDSDLRKAFQIPIFDD